MGEGATAIVKIIAAAQQLGVTSTTRAILVIASAGAVHTMGIALAVSIHAVLYLDFQSTASISVSLYVNLVVAYLLSRAANEYIGSEFAYKRFRRDREAGRSLLRKDAYVNKNNKIRASVELFFTPILFVFFYIPDVVALAVAALPIAFYALIFLLHIFWSWSNDFKRKNQYSALKRWRRMAQKKPRIALSFARAHVLGWVRPRAVGILSMLVISTGAARTIYVERSVQVIRGQFGEIAAAVVFRNSAGFLLSNREESKAWYLSNDGILIPIDASSRPWRLGGGSAPKN